MQREDLVNVARFLKFLYYIAIVAAFCANMIVVSQTTTLTVLGAGMALRGPDGSMMIATDALYHERSSVFYWFAVGLANTVGSVTVCVWLILNWEAALCCMVIVLFSCWKIWTNYKRIQREFAFDESETVDFADIMEGPANIQAVPTNRRVQSSRNIQNGRTSHSKYKTSEMTPFSSREVGDVDAWGDDWQQQNNDFDVKKRRGINPNPGKVIQTV